MPKTKANKPTLDSIEAQLNEAMEEKYILEECGTQSIEDLKEVEVYLREKRQNAERIELLTHVRDRLIAEGKAASKSQIKESLEADERAIRENVFPKLTDAWRKFHAAILDVSNTGAVIKGYLKEVSDLNYRVGYNGREDLVISPSEMGNIKDQVGAEITGIQYQVPLLERMEGETDDAFSLRQGNAQTKAYSRIRNSDPFQTDGDKALGLIDELSFQMGLHAKQKNRRLVESRTYVSPGGQPVQKIADVPGSAMAKSGKVYIGPFRPGMKADA